MTATPPTPDGESGLTRHPRRQAPSPSVGQTLSRVSADAGPTPDGSGSSGVTPSPVPVRPHPLRPCIDCGQPSEGSRCPEHTVDRRRGRAQRSHQWRVLSARIRKQQPWCEHCHATEHLQVDHIVPVSVDPSREYDVSNLRVLCRPCHGRAARNQHHAGLGAGTRQALGNRKPGGRLPLGLTPGVGPS